MARFSRLDLALTALSATAELTVLGWWLRRHFWPN
jgi:hypothetical protein